MKTKDFKHKVNSLNNQEIKKIEMVAYFNSDDTDNHVFWATFLKEDVVYLYELYSRHANENDGFSKQLYNKLLKMYLEPNPDPGFYSVIFGYLCSYGVIQAGLQKYPQGGTAIIAHINVSDETQSILEFMDPLTFDNQRNRDFRVIPYHSNKYYKLSQSAEIPLSSAELVFLLKLSHLITQSGNNCCSLSNENILEFFYGSDITTDWIAETLGKLQEYEFIDIFQHMSDGQKWSRDIFLTDINLFDHCQVNFHIKKSA